MLLCYLTLCLVLASPVLTTLVQTEYGPVRGQTIRVDNGRDLANVDSFYAIPYGKETSGARRFAKPQRPDPWGPEEFIADTLGDACPQSAGSIISVTHPGWDRFSEDCLHINVYTPSPRAGPYPILVWLFGGAFQSGANFQYPGHFYATRDVIVVTVNYRLGPFGFAYTGNDAAPGNQGLWDQNLALQFIQDNIANFGGDPSRVTVFGESAGAASTGMHIISPQSKDIFSGAILESGAEKNIWAHNTPESHPEDYIRQVAVNHECPTDDDYAMMDCLRNMTWEELRSKDGFDCAPGYGCLGMAPVVDGPGGFLPESPHALREKGDVMTGPIMSGINHDDGGFFLPDLVPETLLGCCNRTFFLHALKNRIAAGFSVFDNITTENVFRALDFNYTPWPELYNKWQNRQSLIKIVTDLAFGQAWDEQLKDHADIAPTFGFIYNYRGRNTSRLLPEWIGVPHVAELPYVWGFPLLPLNDALRNDSLMFFDLIDWTEEDVQHSIFMQDLYANFAKYGNPTPTPVDNPLGETTMWLPFTFDATNVLIISNVSIATQRNYRQRDYAFWEHYMKYITDGSWPNGPDPGSSFPSMADTYYRLLSGLAALEDEMFWEDVEEEYWEDGDGWGMY